MEKKFFYSGAFDPFTLQDAQVVAEVSKGGLHQVVIGIEKDGDHLFSGSDRKKMAQSTLLWYDKVHNMNISACVTVIVYSGLPAYAARMHFANTFVVTVKTESEKVSDLKLRISRQVGRSMLSTTFMYHKVVVTHSRDYLEKVIKMLYDNDEYIMLMKLVSPPAHNLMMSHALEYEYNHCNRSLKDWKTFVYVVSQRSYHNLSHIAYMLNKYRLHSTDSIKSNHDRFCRELEMKAAIFFHDYILDDVDRSFEISRLPDHAEGLFMATKHLEGIPDELNEYEQFMHDLDLAILTEKCLYNDYRIAIRQEHLDVSDEEYAVARVAALKKLEQEITKTKLFNKKELKQALLNIGNEIASYDIDVK